MKIRTSFVSNSSSSSFVILKRDLTGLQVEKIRNFEDPDAYDSWYIKENRIAIGGHTTMDNTNIGEFLDNIGVPGSVIDWHESCSCYLPDDQGQKEEFKEETLTFRCNNCDSKFFASCPYCSSQDVKHEE